jgi:hypothetical protein
MPPHVHTETSYRAAEDIKTHVPRLRSLVLGYIQEHGPCTDEQVQDGLKMAGSTQRPRRRELERAGLIEKFDEQGKTKSGRKAVRWSIK